HTAQGSLTTDLGQARASGLPGFVFRLNRCQHLRTAVVGREQRERALSNREVSTGALGWITFAGFMMVISGGFAILQGIGLIANSDQFPGSDSIISQDTSTR